jgi:hypothetical protein
MPEDITQEAEQETHGKLLTAGYITGTQIRDIILRGLDIVLAKQQNLQSWNAIKAEMEKALDRMPVGANKRPEDIVSAGVNYYTDALYNVFKGVEDALPWYSGFPLKAEIIRNEWNLKASLYGLSTWFAITYAQGYACLAEKSRRYWRKLHRPYLPSDEDLFIMRCKGLFEQIGGETAFRRYFAEVTGIDKELEDAYIQHLYYDPSFGELMRISDYYYPGADWFERKLKALGTTDEDRKIMLETILRRPARDEYSRIASILYDEYAMGTISDREFDTILDEFKIGLYEKDAKKTVAKLLLDKSIKKMLRDAEIYLYRTGYYTSPDQLFTALVRIGIRVEVANAITRLEAARKGVNWTAPSG